MDNKTFDKIHSTFLKSYNMPEPEIRWLPKQKEYKELKSKIEKILKI